MTRSIASLEPRVTSSWSARTYSGLGVDQFMRQMTVQELSREGLENLGDAVVSLAGLEGLDGHAAAVTRRLKVSS